MVKDRSFGDRGTGYTPRLKKEFGHPATKSYLYSNPLVDDETKEIIEKYYGNDNNFVNEQGDKIKGNRTLALKLLDEYFDEFGELMELTELIE